MKTLESRIKIFAARRTASWGMRTFITQQPFFHGADISWVSTNKKKGVATPLTSDPPIYPRHTHVPETNSKEFLRCELMQQPPQLSAKVESCF
jgi:arginine utilization protein RocB